MSGAKPRDQTSARASEADLVELGFELGDFLDGCALVLGGLRAAGLRLFARGAGCNECGEETATHLLDLAKKSLRLCRHPFKRRLRLEISICKVEWLEANRP